MELIKVVNIMTGKTTEYGTIDEYMDNAADELYKGNILLPPVYEQYISEEAQKAIVRYKQMINTCISEASKSDKRGLIVCYMQWTAPDAYAIKAFDALNGHWYILEQFKAYSDQFSIIDTETDRYLDCNLFYPYIDWKFCEDYHIPLQRDLYELRTPVDGRYPAPAPIDILSVGLDTTYIDTLREVIDLINEFRTDERLDLLVDRTQMFKLEIRFNQLLRLISLTAPQWIINKEIQLILDAYDKVRLPFIVTVKL